MNVSNAVAEYAAFQETRGDTENHRKETRRILALLQREISDRDLGEVTSSDLQRFLAAIRARPGTNGKGQVSDFTVSAYHRTLAAFFRFVVQQEWISTNPMARVPKPKIGEYLIRPFSQDQIKQLLRQPDLTTFIGLRDMTLMCFLLDTGCRISESLALQYDDLDFEHGLARVMGKGRKERLVPFGTRTAEWLQVFLEKRRQDARTALIFVNQYGEKLSRSAIAHRIARYGKQAGLSGVRTSPHTFRHTFGVNWLIGPGGRFKGDTLSLQQILGHTSPEMTQRYVHLAGGDLKKLHEQLSPADHLVDPPSVQKRRRIK